MKSRPLRGLLAALVLASGAAVVGALACGEMASPAGVDGAADGNAADGNACVGPGCGVPCKVDDECLAGLHCSGGTCSAQCGPSVPCADGRACSPRGRCELGADGACSVTVAPKRPTVLFIVDRSAEMGTPIALSDGGVGTALDAVREALVGSAGLLRLRGDDLRAGVAWYGACLDITGVDVGVDMVDAIAAAFPLTAVGPAATEDAVRRLWEGGVPGFVPFREQDAGGQARLVVLITASPPTSCLAGDAGDAGDADAKDPGPTRQAELFALLPTLKSVSPYYVIGLSTTSFPGLTASEVQSLGGLQLPLPGFGNYITPKELLPTLALLHQELVTCEFDVARRPYAGREDELQLRLGDQPLLHGDKNGWDFTDAGTVALLGSTCKLRKASPLSLSGSAPCDALLP